VSIGILIPVKKINIMSECLYIVRYKAAY